MNFEFLLTYFDKGGFIFALLLMISLVSITIIIYKIFQFFFIDNANAEKLEILIQESASIREFENKILLLNNKENIFFLQLNTRQQYLKKNQSMMKIKRHILAYQFSCHL